MNERLTILLSVIFLLSTSIPSAFAADQVPVGQKQADNVKALTEAIKLGMNHVEADRIVRRVRAGDDLNCCDSQGKEQTLSRYTLGDGTVLLLDYGKVADPSGKLGDDDKVTTVRLLHFDDLKDQVPDDLFQAVRLIHLSPSVNGILNPTSLIQAVNGLHGLGKEKALKAFRAYESLTDKDLDRRFRYDLDEQRIFLVLRLLFVRTDGEAQMPWMYIGGTKPDVKPGDKDWPLFPLVVKDDIPYCLSPGYWLAGRAESPSIHIDYCDKNCTLRKSPLSPSASPLQAVQSIGASEQWHRLFTNEEDGKDTEYLMRIEALRAVANITQKPIDYEEFNSYYTSKKDAEKVWGQYLGDSQLKDAVWDSDHQQFVESRKIAPKP